MKNYRYPRWLTSLLIAALVLGVIFRFVNLDRKVYWHDEAYTSMRAAGYTRHEIDRELFQNQLINATDLQKFQNIKPNSTPADTIRSLTTEDPQHPPLYFLLARFWMALFGGSLTASRLLPALLSLLSLPLMYVLAIELFASKAVAFLATLLLALSPFDILFAQTARQYGLLTTAIIGSNWLLIRAMRSPSLFRWGLYGAGVAFGLYVHPFFGLTTLAQGAYLVAAVVLGFLPKRSFPPDKPVAGKAVDPAPMTSSKPEFVPLPNLRLLGQFLLANGFAVLLYSPWLWVLLSNYQRAAATTDWTKANVPLIYLLKLWILSFSSLFNDLDFGFDNPITYLGRLPLILLILFALYVVYRRLPRTTSLLVLANSLLPFLMLVLPDLVVGGKRSAVSRYLISCYPGIQLVVAYLLAAGLAGGKAFWRWVITLTIAVSLLSLGVSASADTWWNKDLSYFNAEVLQRVNAETEKNNPVLVSDLGDDFTNTGDLMSLSYGFKPNVKLFLVGQPANLEPLQREADILVFRPSVKLKEAIAQYKEWQLEPVSHPAKLWRLQRAYLINDYLPLLNPPIP